MMSQARTANMRPTNEHVLRSLPFRRRKPVIFKRPDLSIRRRSILPIGIPKDYLQPTKQRVLSLVQRCAWLTEVLAAGISEPRMQLRGLKEKARSTALPKNVWLGKAPKSSTQEAMLLFS